jgi:hypothetical protein
MANDLAQMKMQGCSPDVAKSDIKQNSFVGVTAMPQPDGSLNAVEVHIFS